MAKDEGVALNQLINVAVAEKLAATRTLQFFERYTRDANVEEALALPRRPRAGEPPREGDELPANRKPRKAQSARGGKKRASTRSR
jgi:hypothetical protein